MKLVMKRGLPGSGKTTEARALVDTSGTFGRVNRDDLRQMLFNGKWSGQKEGLVIEIEKHIVALLKDFGYSAVVDDTNLFRTHLDMWKQEATRHNMCFEISEPDTTLNECLFRDASRIEQVGAAIIYRMALFSGRIKFAPEDELYLVDIDGTLADGRHREHLLKGEKKRWDAYYAQLHKDKPYERTIELVRSIYRNRPNAKIIIVSGRPDTYQYETIEWLGVNGVPYHYIFMRPGHDKREDRLVKTEILSHLPKSQIKCVFDDRPSVCREWRARGLKLIQWHQGEIVKRDQIVEEF